MWVGVESMKVIAWLLGIFFVAVYLGSTDKEEKIKTLCDRDGAIYLKGKVYRCEPAAPGVKKNVLIV